MRIEISEDCIGCEQCVTICPNVFVFECELDRVVSRFDVLKLSDLEKAMEAGAHCPFNCISIIEAR